jgi:hypothetical protein
MRNYKTLGLRVTKLAHTIRPAARLIDCSRAKDELLLLLSGDTDQDDCTALAADLTEECELDAMLDHSITFIEQRYNVRFTSYE